MPVTTPVAELKLVVLTVWRRAQCERRRSAMKRHRVTSAMLERVFSAFWDAAAGVVGMAWYTGL